MTTANNPVVTAEQIEAGVAAYWDECDLSALTGHERRETVKRIYLAMTQASPVRDEPMLTAEEQAELVERINANEYLQPMPPPDEMVERGDEFLRELYERAFNEGAESTIEQWNAEQSSGDYNRLNSGPPTMPHHDCLTEGSYQFVEDNRAALQSIGPMRGWEPIETAPKDERDILGWCQYTSGECYVHQIFWGADNCHWVDTVDLNKQFPTHWMPLPAPPEALNSQGGVK